MTLWAMADNVAGHPVTAAFALSQVPGPTRSLKLPRLTPGWGPPSSFLLCLAPLALHTCGVGVLSRLAFCNPFAVWSFLTSLQLPEADSPKVILAPTPSWEVGIWE